MTLARPCAFQKSTSLLASMQSSLRGEQFMSETEHRVIRISRAAHENLRCLSTLNAKPMTFLVEKLSSAWMDQWRGRMTADEYQRLLANDVSFAEGKRIRDRIPAL